jgi:pseudaminic acid cytidylyltransferase
MRSLAIIPARGGSKRIPRKNIKDFLWKPIIAYSIEAAINAGCFDVVMVSTDDEEIAQISKSFWASVPFMRSEKNANDTATTASVIEEVLLEYKERGEEFDYVCCLYPAAPFIHWEMLQSSMDRILESDADTLFPIVAFGYPIRRAQRITGNKVSMIWPENEKARTQDLEAAYHDCGQFYCLKVKSFMEQKKIYMKNSTFIELESSRVQDIDNEADREIAQIKYKLLNT